MKGLILLAPVVSACSSGKEEKQIPFTVPNLPEEEWAIYEGKIITKAIPRNPSDNLR